MINKAMSMRQHAAFWLAGLLSVALCGTCAQAQDVSVTDERPIAKAIEKLEHLYRVPITYEDTLYLNDNDVVDVTAAVRLDNDGSNPHRVLVPVRRTITFALPETQAGAMRSQSGQSAAALAAVKSLLDSYALAGGAGVFDVSENSSGLHVVSRAYADVSGQLQSLKPALETRVSITEGLRPAFDVLDEICGQISLGGRVVDVGTVPTNLLANHPVNVDVKSASARDILGSISKQIGVPLSWQLFCDPGDGGCALNMHVVQ
jgi:hypothetical protein